ncbi:RNA polymerase sigma factor [Chitinophaga nivalis]|uniref:Sigma-70 family RNA polymerase sigma factor n=1 Tax=Chitinophaga nivalis TaxID=2991709 RepID=A0ABT3IIB1_9BACT|nr:sigma-70 family RNA polymerase sigma factor [Chitinophaga nivalis]MCW3466612.1 sigma-70 family RNA polymerase sigma factor [Chitinophaga nivalis]MCW3483697.1 sigma-70 family RNA polymerase sigma factor [Chitinophaga nivalis]
MNTGKAYRPGLHVVASHSTLWGRFLQGDRQAFAQIYEANVDDLFHYGMHFCQDRERVKDCLQDLFQDLWLSREHLTADIKNIRYYLISSLRRRLLRTLQKDRRYRHREATEAFGFEFALPHENTLILEETAAEQQRLLHQALTNLSRRQREAIYLRFFQNLSYAEVAAIMSMQVDSVYNTISKAIGILKKQLPLPLILLLLGK